MVSSYQPSSDNLLGTTHGHDGSAGPLLGYWAPQKEPTRPRRVPTVPPQGKASAEPPAQDHGTRGRTRSSALDANDASKGQTESYVARGDVLWKSGKQSVISTSTMEDEFMACFEATIQSLWLQKFGSSLQIIDNIDGPLNIHYDNAAVVFFSKNDRYSKGAKHMDLKNCKRKEYQLSILVLVR